MKPQKLSILPDQLNRVVFYFLEFSSLSLLFKVTIDLFIISSYLMLREKKLP